MEEVKGAEEGEHPDVPSPTPTFVTGCVAKVVPKKEDEVNVLKKDLITLQAVYQLIQEEGHV